MTIYDKCWDNIVAKMYAELNALGFSDVQSQGVDVEPR